VLRLYFIYQENCILECSGLKASSSIVWDVSGMGRQVVVVLLHLWEWLVEGQEVVESTVSHWSVLCLSSRNCWRVWVDGMSRHLFSWIVG